jgi:hypothetical protein
MAVILSDYGNRALQARGSCLSSTPRLLHARLSPHPTHWTCQKLQLPWPLHMWTSVLG